MQKYKYISIPITYLESHGISKKSFMQNSVKTQQFLSKLLSKLPIYSEIKNTFLVNSSFIIAFGKKQKITFENGENFNMFCEFIKTTKYINLIIIDHNKREISINEDIPQNFYNILYEFLI